MRWLHTLNRLAICEEVALVLHVAESDLIEAFRQVQQLQDDGTNLSEFSDDAGQLALHIQNIHAAGRHSIRVGHSQGNLLIAQAIQLLPAIERRPVNVGDACTAAMALASPLGRYSFNTIAPPYTRGLIVQGDILLWLRGITDNDFPLIFTPAGSEVFSKPTLVLQLMQAIKAHYMDPNYLLYGPSESRLAYEMTELSDECSAGAFEVTTHPAQMIVHDTAKIGIDLRNRNGAPLLGRSFGGASEFAYVSGRDSSIFATNITAGSATVAIRLANTSRLQAAVTLDRIAKRPMDVGVTYVLIQNPDGSRYYRYTVTVRRIDQGQFTYIRAVPVVPTLPNDGAGFGSDTPTQEIVAHILQAVEDQGPDIRWEVRTYDGPFSVPMFNLISVDTVDAGSASASLPAPTVESRIAGVARSFDMGGASGRKSRHSMEAMNRGVSNSDLDMLLSRGRERSTKSRVSGWIGPVRRVNARGE